MPAGSIRTPQRVGMLLPLLLLACLPPLALAERLPVKTYTVADGLQRDYVYRIRQDSRGFLWFCTLAGISRFDGVGMTNFTVAGGLPGSFIENAHRDCTGVLWFGTSRNGVARFVPEPPRTREPPTILIRLEPRETRLHRAFHQACGAFVSRPSHFV